MDYAHGTGHGVGASLMVHEGPQGISFNWNWLSNASLATPWFLSGGLNINNINEAVQTTGAAAVDVSSGVEDKAGIKNTQKIIEFMNTVRTL